MKLRKWHKAALIGVGALFVIYMASLGLPAEYPVCRPDDYTHARECSYYHFGPAILASIIAWADIHNGLMTAAATGLLVWITYRLVRLGKDDGITQRAQLRAYISASVESLMLEPDGKILRAFVEIKNNGQTPAFNIKIPSAVDVLPGAPYQFDVIDALPFTTDDINKLATFTLASGKDCFNSPNSTVLDFDVVRKMENGHRLYVVGLIIYKDIFGDDQWIEFCCFLEKADAIRVFDFAEKNRGDKIRAPFKIASFGNDVSFNPMHASRMKEFRQN